MRFVKGDAIAGLLILAISLAGGLVIGVVQRGMPLGDAARLYTLLTIGDGLVSQLPALLISTAAGLVVTRVASRRGRRARSGPIWRASSCVRARSPPPRVLLAACWRSCPGLPLWPFLLVAAGAGALAWVALRRRAARAARAASPTRRRRRRRSRSRSIRRCTPPRRRWRRACTQVTRALADELGLVVPPLSLTIDARLPLRGYEIRLRGMPLADGIIPDGRILVDVAPGKLPAGVEGQAADHPATGAPAAWVPASSVARLPATGLVMLDGPSAIAARLDAPCAPPRPSCVGLDETQRLLDGVAREHPALVRALIPAPRRPARSSPTCCAASSPRASACAICRRCSRRSPAPRDGTRDPAALTERVRAQLTRIITHRFIARRPPRRGAACSTATPKRPCAARSAPPGDGIILALEPDLADALLACVDREAGAHKSPVILTSPELRRHVRRLVEGEHPRLPVLAYQELLVRRRGRAGGHHPYYGVNYLLPWRFPCCRKTRRSRTVRPGRPPSRRIKSPPSRPRSCARSTPSWRSASAPPG